MNKKIVSLVCAAAMLLSSINVLATETSEIPIEKDTNHSLVENIGYRFLFSDYIKELLYSELFGGDETYDVTFGTIENGTVTADVDTDLADGTKVTLTVTPGDGYEVDYIKVNGEALSPDGGVYSFEIDGADAEITAAFKKIKYAVNIASGIANGTVTTTSTEYAWGETVTLTVTPDSYYKIKSVSKDGTALTAVEGVYSFEMPKQAVSISAEFEKKTYAVNIASGITNGTVSATSTEFAWGETVTLTVTPDSGYRIKSVTKDGVALTANQGVYSFEMPKQAVSITAEFELTPATTYAVNIASGITNGTVTTTSKEYVEGATVTLTVTPGTDYKIKSVSKDGTALTPVEGVYSFVMPAKAVSITAEFEKITYAVNIDNSITNGTVTTTSTEFAWGETVTLTVTPGTDYKIKSVSKDGTALTAVEGVYSFEMPKKDVSITAEFEKKTYAVNIASGITNGTVSATSTEFAWGETVTLTVTPSQGYRIKSVTKDGVALTANQGVYSFEMPKQAVSITAEFELIPTYNVTLPTSVANGTVSADVTTALEDGTTVTLTVTPDNGYVVDYVKVNGEPITAVGGVYSFVINGENAVVTVAFKESTEKIFDVGDKTYIKTINYVDIFKTYKVTLPTSVANGTVTVDKETGLEDGTTVTLTVTPNTGYEVDYVKVNDVAQTAEPNGTYKYTIDKADANVTVAFKAIKYKVTIGTIYNGKVSADKTEGLIYGEKVTLTVTPNADYQISSVKVNKVAITPVQGVYSFTITGDANVTATFAKKGSSFNVTLPSQVEHGTVATSDGKTTNIAKGKTITLVLTPDTDYEVDYVKVNDVALIPVEGVYSFKLEADATVEVAFRKIPRYDVVYGTIENGTVTADQEKDILNGTTITLTVTPNAGYYIDYVMVNDQTIMADKGVYSFKIDGENAEVNVSFKKIPTYSVNIGAIENGTITANNVADLLDGTEVTLTVTPNTGYDVDYIKINGNALEAVDGVYKFVIDKADVTVDAAFKEKYYKVILAETSDGYIKTDKTEYKLSETVTITTDPAIGYVLSKLTATTASGTKVVINSNTFGMPSEDVTIKAVFTRQSTGGSGGGSSKSSSSSLGFVSTPQVDANDTNSKGTVINVQNGAAKVTASGADVNSYSNGKAITFDFAGEGFDYVIIDSEGNLVAKATYDATSKKMSAVIDKDGKYYVKLAEKNTFNDVADTAWFNDAVTFVSSRGIMNGVGASEFAPQEAVTRAMVVATLQRLEDPNATDTKTPFVDVSEDAWFAKSVAWAFNNGIVNGISDTEFDPTAPVTREQLAVIISNYLYHIAGQKGEADLSVFVDSNMISDWAKDGVSSAVGLGIITGDNNSKLNPQNSASRAEYSIMLQRVIDSLCK